MALVARDADASIDASTSMYASQITGLIAGENLDALAGVYIKASDGLVFMATGAAANEAATFIGIVPRAVRAGEPCTIYGIGARMRYGAALVPGAKLFVAATAGRLDTAATTGDALGVARAIDVNDILITRVA